jgi:AAA15 family ATPase/GTPase
MYIRFKNLGQIKDTKLTVRPLTVIIGPNNSNKTYVAYSVYGLLTSIRSGLVSFPDSNTVTQEPNLWKTALDSSLCIRLRARVKASVEMFQRDMTAYFEDTSKKIFSATKFTVSLPNSEILHSAKTSTVAGGYMVGKDRYRVSVEGDYIVVRPAEPAGSAAIPESPVISTGTVLTMMMHWLLQVTFASPFLLPAERNAFVITYKTLIGNRNKEVTGGRRQRKTNEPDSAQAALFESESSFRYPAPVEDFLQFLYDSEQKRPVSATSEEYAKIASDIEMHLQNANRTHYRAAGLGYELAVEVTKDLTIDLYNASSSIKQLAPLLIYLRYRARHNDLIIIDEPEMNLHPESQAKLIEALAMMVNSGINVLLTTHSPYVMQHINNLLMQRQTSPDMRERMAKALYLDDSNAFLDPKQVSAYEMRNGELVSLEDADYGIRWDTLSNVSIALREKYFDITEAANGQDG